MTQVVLASGDRVRSRPISNALCAVTSTVSARKWVRPPPLTALSASAAAGAVCFRGVRRAARETPAPENGGALCWASCGCETGYQSRYQRRALDRLSIESFLEGKCLDQVREEIVRIWTLGPGPVRVVVRVGVHRLAMACSGGCIRFVIRARGPSRMSLIVLLEARVTRE